MGPVALLVFKTSESANNGLVGSTPTRLRQLSPQLSDLQAIVYSASPWACITLLPE